MIFRYEKEKYRQGYSHVIGCDEVGKGSLAGPVVAAAVVLPLQAAVDKLKVESYKVIKSCGIKDSKLLLPKKREELSDIIKQNCVAWGIGSVEPIIIDEINIHQATLLAMRRAVENMFKRINTDIADGLALITDVVQAPGLPVGADIIRPAPYDTGHSPFEGGKIISSPTATKQGKALHYNKYFLFLDGKFTIPMFDMEQEAVVDGDNKILSVAAASIVAKVHRDDLMRKLHEQYPCYDFAQHKGYGTLHHRKMILKHGLSGIHRASFCRNFI